MGRWLGGVYGNTKLATDSQNDATGVYTISDQYYMRREGGWIQAGVELHIQAWGAGGGGGTVGGWNYGSPAGSGGYTEARINVPGEYRGTNLLIVVGAGGVSNGGSTRAYCGGGCNNRPGATDNRYAGSGGGLAGVFLNYNATAENCLVIAAGGGGGDHLEQVMVIVVVAAVVLKVLMDKTLMHLLHTLLKGELRLRQD